MITTNLKTEYPELAKEWHPTKNGELTPYMVAPKSHLKVWWCGSCGHEWQAAVSSRANGHGCPYCSGNKTLAGYNDLVTVNPALAEEWNYTKNGELNPSMVSPTAHLKVWWIGKCGHEWMATVNHRAKGKGCPICANSQILIGVNDFATTYPKLAKEWHPTKNNGLTPEMVVAGSEKKVWWLGKCGHEWQAAISSRVGGRNCPICAGRQVLRGFNDLATVNPKLSAEWHSSKNGELTPENVTAGSQKSVWWICEEGHEWQAAISWRTRGRNCPICAGKKVCVGYNDLATTNPILAEQWHPTKNGNLTPKDITQKSGKKVWWMCKKGHEWSATIASRTEGRGCPVCGKELQTSFPEQATYFYIKQVFPDAVNADKSAAGVELDIYIPSIKYAVEYDGLNWHKSSSFEKRKNEICKSKDIKLIRIREEGLSLFDDCCCIQRKDCKSNKSLNTAIQQVLQVLNKIIIINVDVDRDEQQILESFIITTKEKSLKTVFPDIADEWHPHKNGKLTSDMLSYGSKKRVWWICNKGHEWQASLSDRIRGNECPFCSNRKVLKGYNDLLTTNPTLAKQWHPEKNLDLQPDMIMGGSHKKVWWLGECGHEWEATVNNRSKGSGCPYCANRKVLAKFNDLATIFPEIAKEWHPDKNGELTPAMVTSQSNKKVWWMCENGHEWQARVEDRAHGNACPVCRKQKK